VRDEAGQATPVHLSGLIRARGGSAVAVFARTPPSDPRRHSRNRPAPPPGEAPRNHAPQAGHPYWAEALADWYTAGRISAGTS